MTPVALPSPSSTFQPSVERGTYFTSIFCVPVTSSITGSPLASKTGSSTLRLVMRSVPKERLRTQKPLASEASSKSPTSTAASGTPAATASAASSASPIASSSGRRLNWKAASVASSSSVPPWLPFRSAKGR